MKFLAPDYRSHRSPGPRGVTGSLAAAALGLCLLWGAPPAGAEELLHTFSISGDNGETGFGYFTWDDQVVPNGSSVSASLANTGNIIELRIEISGGRVIGGTTVFTLTDCVGAYAEVSPDFSTDINFICNNTVNTLSAFDLNINYMNDADDLGTGNRQPVLDPDDSSVLTFSPGQTRSRLGTTRSIPASPLWSLFLLAGLLPLLARLFCPRPLSSRRPGGPERRTPSP